MDRRGGGPRGGVALGAVLDGPFGEPDAERAGGVRLGLDGGIKVAGFTAIAEGFLATEAGAAWTDQAPARLGARVEANRLVDGWLPAVRAAAVRDLDDDTDTTELTAGLGYLLDGHHAKAQADVGWLDGGDWTGLLVRAQAQLAW